MDTELDESYRQRVRLLRKLYGMTQAEWAEFTGIAYKKWNHYERGYPVSRESLFILRAKVGVSADWLYWNDPCGLSFGTMNLLRALEQSEKIPEPQPNGHLKHRAKGSKLVRKRLSIRAKKPASMTDTHS